MEPIKIEVSVKLNLSDDAKNFIASLASNFIASLLSKQATPVAKSAATASAPATPVAKPAATAPATPVAKPAATASAPAKPVEKPAEEKAEVSVEDVRKALTTKVANHRAEIKEKLNMLGAPSVTKLDPTKYQEMFDFLNALD